MTPPQRFSDADAIAEALIERLSGCLRVALPLGLGKPALLVNALYRKARERPDIELDIYTALSLTHPRPRSELERRLLGPVAERLYRNVPELDYAVDHGRGALPPNVRVTEFYFRPGAALGNAAAQRSYISSNYTHVARDLVGRGVNVIAQMVAPAAGTAAGECYSLSCNPDLTRDLLDAARRARSTVPLMAGEVNRSLPFLSGSAEMTAGEFEYLLEGDHIDYELFPVPNRPVGLVEQVIGIRVAALVRDGGTLQIGIGSLGDAVAHAVAVRRTVNARFRELVNALGITAPAPELDALPGGLYAASEMFVEGFLHLREHGVLERTVDDGAYLHAGFYLGSQHFYERLRHLPDAERRGIAMTRISFTNTLLGDEYIKRRQRRDARFVNTAMMVTLLGAAVSDGLEDGRVVSGVGGQYNFVAMAHELEGARSVLVLPATRTSAGKVTSNIVWRYGHVTIPRHLRDVVVTEYGVADLRGASDQDVIVALLNLADSRFQEGLRKKAVASGKLSCDYRIPERFRRNTPQRLRDSLTNAGLLDVLPWFPLGTDLTGEESELSIALASLGEKQGSLPALARTILSGWPLVRRERLQPALERMGLHRPRGLRQRAYRALLASALVRDVHDQGRPLLPRPAVQARHEREPDPQTPARSS